MQVYCGKDYAQMSRKVANILSAQIILKPDSVLGLATGSTPIGAYDLLVKWCNRGDLDFSHDKYKYDCSIKCANYGMDLEVLLKQLYIMNKKLSQKIPA